MKLQIPEAINTRFARQVLVTQKNSPKFLFGAGLVLMGATVVSACRGTMKLDDVLEDVRRDRLDLKVNNETFPHKFTEREYTRYNARITTRGLFRVAKLYTPALIFGSLSVAALTGSHNTLTRRNAGLSAALAATDRALNAYRARIREEYGDEKERDLYIGKRTESVPVLDDEGRETKHKKKVVTRTGESPYQRVWGRDTSTEWDPQPEYNLAKLRSVQEWATIKMTHRGHLFLNEVYTELGLSHTPAGAVCGWMSEKNGGIGYADFGVMEAGGVPKFLEFITGHEDHITLDFNVDGEIWRLIDND